MCLLHEEGAPPLAGAAKRARQTPETAIEAAPRRRHTYTKPSPRKLHSGDKISENKPTI